MSDNLGEGVSLVSLVSQIARVLLRRPWLAGWILYTVPFCGFVRSGKSARRRRSVSKDNGVTMKRHEHHEGPWDFVHPQR